MKTARELAEAVLPTRYRGLCKPGNEHHQDCNTLTAAIEARDAEITSTLHGVFGASEAELMRALDENRASLTALTAERNRLREALEFYADPGTWFGVALFGDSPCGEIVEDFDATELGEKPGKRARAALKIPGDPR